MDEPGLVSYVSNLIGGAATTILGALLGRLMWHTGEVRKGARRFFGIELLWEIPIVCGMAFIGEGIAEHFALSQTPATAVVGVAAYIGPRGAEAILSKWLTKAKI